VTTNTASTTLGEVLKWYRRSYGLTAQEAAPLRAMVEHMGEQCPVPMPQEVNTAVAKLVEQGALSVAEALARRRIFMRMLEVARTQRMMPLREEQSSTTFLRVRPTFLDAVRAGQRTGEALSAKAPPTLSQLSTMEPERALLECLLRLRMHLEHLAGLYDELGEALHLTSNAATECLARAAQGPEVRSVVESVLLRLSARRELAQCVERAARTEAVAVLEPLARGARARVAAPAARPGFCPLCANPIATPVERLRGHHFNCPEAPTAAQGAEEGGVP
jgi:hypothetical protein